MLTRTAIYEGRIRSGHEEEFFREVEEKLEPIWQQFPNVRAVRVQRTVERDTHSTADPHDTVPAIAMILEMDYSDHASLRESLASPIKDRAHAATMEVMRLFEGRFYHVVSEAVVFGPLAEDAPAAAPTAG